MLPDHFRFLRTADDSQHKSDIKEQTVCSFFFFFFRAATKAETTKQRLVSYCSDVFNWNVKQNAVPLHLTENFNHPFDFTLHQLCVHSSKHPSGAVYRNTTDKVRDTFPSLNGLFLSPYISPSRRCCPVYTD